MSTSRTKAFTNGSFISGAPIPTSTTVPPDLVAFEIMEKCNHVLDTKQVINGLTSTAKRAVCSAPLQSIDFLGAPPIKFLTSFTKSSSLAPILTSKVEVAPNFLA